MQEDGLSPAEAQRCDPRTNGKGGALLDGRLHREFPGERRGVVGARAHVSCRGDYWRATAIVRRSAATTLSLRERRAQPPRVSGVPAAVVAEAFSEVVRSSPIGCPQFTSVFGGLRTQADHRPRLSPTRLTLSDISRLKVLHKLQSFGVMRAETRPPGARPMTADAAPATNVSRNAKIFISYSREDIAFVDQLEAALKVRGFEPLIDRTDIYAFEDWWARIQSLIGKADTIVFVLSPDAVASDICAKEVAYSASLNKRFAPIIFRPVRGRDVPEAIRRLNYIFFDGPSSFEASADRLAEALQTDISWIRQHTELGELARHWAAAGRHGPRGLLLRSPVLEKAEHWIASRPHNAPAPTEETRAFIAQSRRAAMRRRNVLSAGLAAGLLVALALAGLAYWQRGVAVEQRDLALRNQSASLAAFSKITLNTSPVQAAKLALATWPRGSDDLVPKVDAVLTALSAAFLQLRERKIFQGHKYAVRVAAFSPDGTQIVTTSDDATARVWNVATAKQTAVLVLRDLHDDQQDIDPIPDASFSPDGTRIVTADLYKGARLWDAASGNEIARFPADGIVGIGVSSARFSPDGNRIVTASGDGKVRLWDAASAEEIGVLVVDRIGFRSAEFSRNGQRILTLSNGGKVRLLDVTSAKEIAVFDGGRDVNSAALSPDGTRVVTASDDRTAHIWDVASGKEIAVLRGHADYV